MKIIFFGNTEFSNPTLEKCNASLDVVSVVTNPSKRMGRGRRFSDTPVKILADKLKINVIQVENLENKDFVQKLRDLKPDLFVVVAYKILPKLLLSIPTMGAINLHSSLLPKYRGAAPIQRSILNHDKITGISTFLIEPKVDTGKILMQKECKISDNDNYGSLSSKLSNIGAQLIVESIEKYSSGDFSPIIQDEKLVTLAPKIKKEEYIIDWKKDLTTIDAQIKAFSPHPGAYTMINGKRLKIFEAKMIKGINYKEVGKIINLSKTCFEVTCLSGSLKVYEVQIEGKKRMSSKDFMIGMSNLENVILG